MAIDPRYIPAFSIEDVLLDKDTGAPLSGGLVYFEEDNQRGTLKPVYQITGTSPDYNYIQLVNPMVLSSIGTFEDAMGNPVVPYFFPYSTDGMIDYYYVNVLSSDSVPQFNRQAVPYIPSSGSNVGNSTSNQISNPQFALVKFDTSAGAYTYNFTSVIDSIIPFAYAWFLDVNSSGAGTVTVEQLTPLGSVNIITNPGTILQISSSGVSQVLLKQRLQGITNLWSGGYVSASFVAKTSSGSATNLTLFYSQSNGIVVDEPIVVASLPATNEYASFGGSFRIPASGSNDDFPNGYVDIYFDIPIGVTIDITSVMLEFTGSTGNDTLPYDQASFFQQLNNLYWSAWPIVPIGTIIDYFGFGLPPAHYIECNGQEASRILFNQLFKVLTNLETVTLTSGSAVFTVANGGIYAFASPLEGIGITPGTIIAGISGNTITMNAVATANISTPVRFFATGRGNGSTTFSIPNLNGWVLAGAGAPGYGTFASTTGAGSPVGATTFKIEVTNMPAHTHPGSSVGLNIGTFVGGSALGATEFDATSPNTAVSVATQGDGTPISIIQPTILSRKMIRYD